MPLNWWVFKTKPSAYFGTEVAAMRRISTFPYVVWWWHRLFLLCWKSYIFLIFLKGDLKFYISKKFPRWCWCYFQGPCFDNHTNRKLENPGHLPKHCLNQMILCDRDLLVKKQHSVLWFVSSEHFEKPSLGNRKGSVCLGVFRWMF